MFTVIFSFILIMLGCFCLGLEIGFFNKRIIWIIVDIVIIIINIMIISEKVIII